MADIQNCPCGSGKPLSECCAPIIHKTAKAQTPEELMRARYTAHTQRDYQFLVDSTHPDHREEVSAEEIAQWAEHVNWESLEILSATPGDTDEQGIVSFVAHYNVRNIPQELREDSYFEKIDDSWFYVDGQVHGQEPFFREEPRVGRNEACPCNSGKKYKKCCGK